MLLSNIANDSTVFVDANIFVYHFTEPSIFSDPCSEFLKRIEQGDILGYSSTSVVGEVLHRLMIIEGSRKLNIPPSKVLSYLKKKPSEISNLSDHLEFIEGIKQFNTNILTTTFEDLSFSKTTKKKYCLMTNDSISISLMQRNNIFNLASNDPDFERVDFITIYKPIERL